jgi:shikimate dehydrogenase
MTVRASGVLTLADLEHWEAPGPSLAVLGHPIAHSLSPAMHHAALARLAEHEPEFRTWRYHKFDVPPEELGRALPMLHAKGFVGLNLTIPHKVLAVGLVERIEPFAAEAGAVNTLRRTATGYEGFNTDGYGIVQAVEAAFGRPVHGRPVVLLGAGGAARAAAAAFLRAGCAGLHIGNRSAGSLDELLARVRPVAEATGIGLRGFLFSDPPDDLPMDALVINATSAGLRPDDPVPLDLARLSGRPDVYDMIYNPALPPVLREARVRGLRAAGGLSMLAHQGARALERWTGRPIDAGVMLRACEEALASR